MSELDNKINTHFSGLVVRKDLVKTVKGNAIVPSYVLEYLLGQYCATSDEPTILTGIETVKEILRKHYVHRNEAGLIRSNIKEKGRYKVIDRVYVSLNDKNDVYEAEFSNLGIKNVLVESEVVKKHPKLLVSGVWCITDLEYEFNSEEKGASPFILSSIKPIQLSNFDFEGYQKARHEFTTQEWIGVLLQSIGFNPDLFGDRNKLAQLLRLVPFCERNYNLIELGPKGTGKSHIYSEFSPHGMLVSGGEVTVPKLFVSNSTGKIGLVGYWDVVAFDEFAGKKKSVDKALVDILKNYMANKTFSRGVETLGAEASMVFVGNTDHTVPHMLKHTDLFDPLPDKFHDSAFLDRIHAYVPGWEFDNIRNEMFSDGYGFVVDYLAEILRHLRNLDYSDRYQKYFTLSTDISTRDLDGIKKTFSGLMKIIYPNGEASKDEIEELLRLAIECRKRVKDQLIRIDNTYSLCEFSYKDSSGKMSNVPTLEEVEYPSQYYQGKIPAQVDVDNTLQLSHVALGNHAVVVKNEPKVGHKVYFEGQKGVTFDLLFADYLSGAVKIELVDPYIRAFFQVKNLMDLMETVCKSKPVDEDVSFHLVTMSDEKNPENQTVMFEDMQNSLNLIGVKFTWEYDTTRTIHARHLTTDTGWKISLDRGLDIYQQYDIKNTFSITNRMPEYRQCKAFEVTYLKI